MSKIRALNGIVSESESDEDSSPKLSKEAQEELVKKLYATALSELAKGRRQEAADLFQELVDSDLLCATSEHERYYSPFQQKMQLGCLKILGDLYREGGFKDLERAKMFYQQALIYKKPDSVNIRYRYAKVCYEAGDLYCAYEAFYKCLEDWPGHWGSLEKAVTLSYAVQDYEMCLKYCAMGLKKDAGFVKGLVFRDMVFDLLPELREYDQQNMNYSELYASRGYDGYWRDKYMTELKSLETIVREKIAAKRKKEGRKEVEEVVKRHFNLESWSLVEVCKKVKQLNDDLVSVFEVHKRVILSWSVDAGKGEKVESEDISRPTGTEESQTEEESQTCIRRSRSSSDDKDTVAAEPCAVPELEVTAEKSENCSENSQQQDLPTAQNLEAEQASKKKKRDVKWWQMAGKRRSQRVRGHLIPVSPDKAKKESSFADQLKNLIPASLLCEDGSVSERESTKGSDKSAAQKIVNSVSYFNTKDEIIHVKKLLNELTVETTTSMIRILIRFISTEIKCPWTPDLREVFLDLSKVYMELENLNATIHSHPEDRLITNAYVCLIYLEIVTEKYKTELTTGKMFYWEIGNDAVFYLDHCLSNLTIPVDLTLRVKWLYVRRLLQMREEDNFANQEALALLSQMENILRTQPVSIVTVNENSNAISLEITCEKSAGIAKIQNSQMITDLYQNEEYETLVKVLRSCINFSEIEKGDLPDFLYYTVSLFRTGNKTCVTHCLDLMKHAMQFQDNSILLKSLLTFEEIWNSMQTEYTISDKRATACCLLKVLVSCERKPPSQESILSIPWCILHSVLFSLEREEPAFYLEEETVPNSVLLLQMAHEFMSRTENCCVDNGKLLVYTMKAILEVKKLEEYFCYEETKQCMEQAVFCLYSHPSKKSKLKNLKDHNSTGMDLRWDMCTLLYQYYMPEEIPEFDSYGSIGSDVEALFQRLLEIMPSDLKPSCREKELQLAIKNCSIMDYDSAHLLFPKDLQDIYYLIGDFYFKNKEWSKAVTNYSSDLALKPTRFDSWAGIALSLGENINTTLNTADVIDFKDLLSDAQSTAYCFRNALKLERTNIKLRIEFGSFVYAMHAYCSRLMKQHAAEMDMDLFHLIEEAKEEFLKNSYECFDQVTKNNEGNNGSSESEANEEELWIHHYMLGKIQEKMLFEDSATDYLTQYELAGKLLHDQGAPYPSKMNYYSPPDLALEALEIYYRIHATILNLVEKGEYSATTEKIYVEFLRRQENGPFIKNKQSKGEGGDGKKGKKANDEIISKKDMAEVTSLVNDLLSQVETLVTSAAAVSSESSSSTTSSTDESSSDSIKSLETTKPKINSFSLTEFRKRLQEKELREEKIAAEAKKQDSLPSAPEIIAPLKSEDIYEGLDLENNPFYEDFKDVKFGGVIALSLKAMEECIRRYPSHFKSYFRLTYTYVVFLKDWKRAKEYLMGSPNLSQRKISGLFGERKATNLFNGIWRNPIDDIERPGSFSYHMNKAMHLLLDVLSQLNDHQLLADIVLQLAKIPDKEKKYLSNPDREQFCQQALNFCVASAKKKQQEPNVNFNDLGLEVFETYTKLQKHNSRINPLMSTLHDIYKSWLNETGVSDENVTVEQALRFFNFQTMTLKAHAKSAGSKGSLTSQNSNDDQLIGGEGPIPRKRGRRNVRQSSQEIAMPVAQDPETYNIMAAAFQVNPFFDPQAHASSLKTLFTASSSRTLYPTMKIDAQHQQMNPFLGLKGHSVPNQALGAPPIAHSSTKHAIPNPDIINVANTAKASATIVSSSTHNKGFEGTGDAILKGSNKGRPQIARKSTSQGLPKYPPLPSLQPIRINTSPFKAQSTAVEQPPKFSYVKKPTEPTTPPSEGQGPPLAHYQAHRKPQHDDQNAVEVIDLTVKTPEKVIKVSAPVDRPPKPDISERKRALPDPRPGPSCPLPLKKKLKQMLFRNQNQPPSRSPENETAQNQPDVEVIVLD